MVMPSAASRLVAQHNSASILVWNGYERIREAGSTKASAAMETKGGRVTVVHLEFNFRS
jgi:hypothetical protein